MATPTPNSSAIPSRRPVMVHTTDPMATIHPRRVSTPSAASRSLNGYCRQTAFSVQRTVGGPSGGAAGGDGHEAQDLVEHVGARRATELRLGRQHHAMAEHGPGQRLDVVGDDVFAAERG